MDRMSEGGPGRVVLVLAYAGKERIVAFAALIHPSIEVVSVYFLLNPATKCHFIISLVEVNQAI